MDRTDNELNVLEVIHRSFHIKHFRYMEVHRDVVEFILRVLCRYVEVLDKYFGSVCELDIIFNFEKAYFILDELILGGEMQVRDYRM